MKRYLAIGAGVLVLAMLGWGGVWWSGRAEIERTLDDAVARLRAEGWTVTWDEREVEGFPFGYTVELTGLSASDADSGLALRLPWAVAETHGAERIVIRMPESFAAELPVPAPAAAAAGATSDAGAPAMIAALGESDAMVVVLTADGTIELTADRVAWTVDQPEAGRRVTQTIERLEATTVPDKPGARYRVQAARVAAEIALAEPGGESSTATASLRDVTVEASSSLGSAEALGEMLYAGAPGMAEAALTTGEAEVRIAAAGEAPGLLDWRAGSIRGSAALSSGRMELTGETRANRWTLDAEDPAMPVRGEVSAALARASYAMPMAPTERPDDMAIGLAIDQAVADEQVWASLDPDGALPREPASLALDISGTVRVTERVDRLRPGSPPPFEISGLVLDTVSVKALGASLDATGELDILQPIGLPLGEIRLGLTGLEALVRALGRAGVLTAEMVVMAEAIMAVYLRRAEGEDAWSAQVEFTREGPLVNGLPVQ